MVQSSTMSSCRNLKLSGKDAIILDLTTVVNVHATYLPLLKERSAESREIVSPGDKG